MYHKSFTLQFNTAASHILIFVIAWVSLDEAGDTCPPRSLTVMIL